MIPCAPKRSDAAIVCARDHLRQVPGLTVVDGPHVDPAKLILVLSGTGADGNAIEQDLLLAGMPVESADRGFHRFAEQRMVVGDDDLT